MTVLIAQLEAGFSALLPLSLAAAAAAVVIAAVVWLLHRIGAPRVVTAALWLAVLVRLVCPVGLPLRIFLPEAPAQVVKLSQSAAVREQPADSTAILTVPEQNTGQPEGAPQAMMPRRTAALVWLAGAGVLALRMAWRAARLRRSLRFACRQQEPGGVVYYIAEEIAAPFVLGLLRPRIYLPQGIAETERRAVLAHEQAHLCRGDHLLRPVFYLAACLHWFNPAAWWAFRAFCRESEAACDEAALRTLGEAAKSAYCRVLLRFAATDSPGPALTAFAPDGLPARIHTILTWKKPRRWISTVSVVLTALVFTACMAQPTVQTQKPSSVASSQSAVIQTAGDDESRSKPEEIPWLWPVPEYRYVSQWDGSHAQNSLIHTGVDICAEQDAAIVAAADGTVAEAGWDAVGAGYGYCIRIDHGNGTETIYAHCHELFVQAGDEVTAGQCIAAVGSTGRSTGSHLHWELRIDGENISPQEVFPEYQQ